MKYIFTYNTQISVVSIRNRITVIAFEIRCSRNESLVLYICIMRFILLCKIYMRNVNNSMSNLCFNERHPFC